VKLRDTVRKTGFLVHGFGDGDVDFFSVVKVCADFIAEFAFGDFDVVLGGTFVGHQVEETIIDVNLMLTFIFRGKYQLVFGTDYVGDVHVVGGGTEIFVLSLSEDLLLVLSMGRKYINSDQMDFSVTVLSSFRGTHIDDLEVSFNYAIQDG
jgi:hypothetical protein